MKRTELVGWLKVIIVVAFAMGAVFCFGIAPNLGREIAVGNPEVSYLFWPCLVFVWVTAAPFAAALTESWKICTAIQKGKAFCGQNAARLKRISFMAFSECILYFAALAFLTFTNLLFPAALILILVIQCIGFAIAIFAAILSHLTAKAGELQNENNLTI